MLSRGAVLAIGFVICSGGLARANLLTNGDFENPGNISGQVTMSNASTDTPTGWAYSGSGNDYYSSSGYFDISAESGGFYVAFGQNGTSGGTLSQTFTTVSGTDYQVSFWVAEQQSAGASGDDFSMAAFDGATVINSLSSAIIGETWTQQSFFFQATSSSTTLLFTDLGGPDNQSTNLALDNVDVSGTSSTPSGVPEPFTLSLFGTGLLGLSQARRTRARRKAS